MNRLFHSRQRVISPALLLWLLAQGALPAAPSLDWQSGAGFRSAAVHVPAAGRVGFTALSESTTGVAFTNWLPQSRHLTNQVLLNGSGVAAGDIDGDGLCDVYLCGLTRRNALYRNLGGWKFQDITDAAGVACADLTSTGAAFADLDGDGDLDLIVNSVGHGTRVFLNDSRGRFKEFAVLNAGKAGMSLAVGDLDGNGFLDLYVANYRTLSLMDMPNTLFNFGSIGGQRVIARVNGRLIVGTDLANRYRLNARGGVEENGEADEIFLNAGGRFTPLPFDKGAFLDEEGRPLALPPFDWGLSVMIRDFNQDGLPDIWVCNDFDTPDRVWLNQGGGRFRAAPKLAFRKSSHFSMGIDVADINRDGFDDILVVDMLSRDHVQRMDMAGDRVPQAPVVGLFENRPDYMMNTLFLNRGDGTYAEIAQLAGVSATEWSWTPLFLDVDLDGFEDLLVANGHERAARSMDVAEQLRLVRQARQLTPQEIFENRSLFPRQNAPNLAFRNRGDLTFEDSSAPWGFAFDGVSHGMCLADLDNDGDLDVLVNNLNGPAGFYRNDGSAPRLGVRLKGLPPNTRGIGARITVRGGVLPAQSQEMICGGRYLSSDDAMRVFAAGSTTNEFSIEVAWRSGKTSLVSGAKPNRLYEIDEALATPHAKPERRNPQPLFADASALLHHTHTDAAFDDFTRQPLLPHKLSQLGPGVSWCDIDGDGRDDLFIGSGRGGALAAFWNDGAGGFQRITDELFNQPAGSDQTTILKWTKAPGDVALLIGIANYEDGSTNGTNGTVARELNLRGAAARDLPGQRSSTGPLALADIDGDGRLDLFVGGRVVPGRWPEPASSLVFRGAGNAFLPDVDNTKTLAGVGLVSGAVFADLDGDGLPDLILACEWGPLKILRNRRGTLEPWDPKLTFHDSTRSEILSRFTGSGNGVAAGDFDGDGRLDLVVTGWGMNTRYQAHLARPVELIYGDFNHDGGVQAVECYFDPARNKRVTERQLDFLARGLPFLKERFSSHVEFGRASVEEVLGSIAGSAGRLAAVDFRSCLLLNRGDHFVLRPLPIEAQMAPAFAAVVADFDGDGNEDVFLSQNFFAFQPEAPRCDAGLGLVLAGDGHGGFRALSATESGLRIYGEQRGAAAGDFDRDGRVDLVVTQNGAQTKLLHNVGARPGLRVRLAGPEGNPDAVGAVLRVRGPAGPGPARQIHAGSGYWSQDSPVAVLASVGPMAKLEVHWPGGKVVTSEIPPGAREVTVDFTGKIVTTK